MANATIVNFAAGETSPKSRGRFDIASYTSSCRKLENFIAEVSGAARYRPGFRFIERTRRAGDTAGYSQKIRIIPFQINDDYSYVLEFTRAKMRVYRNGALQSIPRTTVTGVTDVSGDAKIMVDSLTGLAAEDEIVITGVVGATQLNNQVFRITPSPVGGNGVFIFDPTTGVRVLYAALAAYVSGGAVSEVVTVASPYYTDDDFASLNFAQTPGALYIASYRHPPYKATVDTSTGAWTLAVYSRTSDPFVSTAAINVTGKSEDDVNGRTYVTLASAAVDGHRYTLATVGGVPDLNAKWRLRLVASVGGSPTYEVTDPNTDESVSISGIYTSGGTATPDADCPVSVAFYEGRLVFAGTNFRPSTLFLSRSPDPTTGASRYDDFTGGADADHACFFTLAPVNGQIDAIVWAAGTSKYLLVGAFGGPFRVSGGGLEEPITPSSVNVRPLDSYGCAASMPALNGSLAYYIQRGGKTLRGIKYSVDADDFASFDMCLNADQIGDSELKRVVFQAGRPDALWVVRADGELASCTIQEGERVSGWHRHVIGGTAAKVLDVAVLPRPGMSDQLYIVTERTVNGATLRAVEAMADDVVFPDIEDYFTAAAAESTDAASYRAAALALLRTAVHLDAYETYNGAAATVISGLNHLIGQTVTAVADGVEVPNLVVSAGGAITLPVAASIVNVGLPYTGLLQTQNLEVGGRTGPAQAKPRNINALNIRFLNSKGGKYGTDLYHMFDIDTEDPNALKLADGSAAPVFNGIRALQHSDVWSTETDRNEKTVFVQQAKPFPCVVQFIDIEYETGDE